MRELSCDGAIERLPGLVVGDLPSQDERAIEVHIWTCRECTLEANESRVLSRALDLIGRQRAHDRPPTLSRLHDQLSAALPPSVASGRFDSPLGPLYLVASDTGLCRLAFWPSEAEVTAWGRRAGLNLISESAAVRPYAVQLEQYLAGTRRRFDLPIDLSSAPLFTQQVLQVAVRIPFGQIVSYRDIAQEIGHPGAARAVGQALGGNPVPIVVPCHRVVRSDGSLGGYIGGLDVKRQLLALESALPSP